MLKTIIASQIVVNGKKHNLSMLIDKNLRSVIVIFDNYLFFLRNGKYMVGYINSNSV